MRKSDLWRIAARVYRESGRMKEYEWAARTAAIIERRPWKVDRAQEG